jgi:hypothetical protein
MKVLPIFSLDELADRKPANALGADVDLVVTGMFSCSVGNPRLRYVCIPTDQGIQT